MPIQGTPSGIMMGELFNISVFPYTSNANKIYICISTVVERRSNGALLANTKEVINNLHFTSSLTPIES